MSKKTHSSRLNFLKVSTKDYRVGAFTRSSRYVIKKISRLVQPDWKFVIEYGPGDGVITKELLKFLPDDGRLVVIESNDQFIEELLKIRLHDERLVILHGNVKHVMRDLLDMDLPKADAVISGIPFTFFPPSDREEMIYDAHQILKDAGSFIAYQTSPLLSPLLRDYFSSVEVSFELRNLPPYFIMNAQK